MEWTKLYLKNEVNLEGRSTVIISISINGQRIRLGSGVTVKPMDWNATKQEVRRTSKNYVEQNLRLKDRVSEIERAIAQHLNTNKGVVDLKVLQVEFSRRRAKDVAEPIAAPLSFWEMYQRFISMKSSEVAPRTLAKYETVRTLLKEFQIGRGQIDFASINHDFGDSFSTFLIAKKNHTNNTVGKYMSTFKTFLLWAHERGAELSVDYRKFRVPEEEVEIVALTADELQQLEEFDLSTKDRLQRVRDVFLFACYTGARFSDVQTLHKDDIRDNVWHLRMHKTKSETLINLNQHARRIIDKYRVGGQWLPVFSSQKMNSYLKELGKLVSLTEPVRMIRYKGAERIEERGPKWQFLTTHVARRTFVTLSLERGMRSDILMSFTGHKSHKTLKRYIALTDKSRQEAMEKVWG